MSRALVEGDAGSTVEDGGDLSVDLDELVSLDGDPFVPGGDLGLHPLFKLPTSECREHVDDPLLWEASALLLLRWEERLQVRVVVDVAVNLLEAESFVLWNVAVSNLILLDVLLLSTDDVF